MRLRKMVYGVRIDTAIFRTIWLIGDLADEHQFPFSFLAETLTLTLMHRRSGFKNALARWIVKGL